MPNMFTFICGYCGYESDDDDSPCPQCGCENWKYIDELMPSERSNFTITEVDEA